LRVSCANTYPGIMDECQHAIQSVLAKAVQRVPKRGCTDLQAYSMHWPCVGEGAGV
jgi:hypothetical protein